MKEKWLPGQLFTIEGERQWTSEMLDVVAENERHFLPAVYRRAGIVDMNRIYNKALPAELREQCGEFPNVQAEIVYPMLFELGQAIYSKYALTEFGHPNFETKHHLFPVVHDGLIAELAETRFFSRLFGIHQLGLNRYYPILNRQNRGEHSIYTTIDMVRSLQKLNETCPATLQSRLRKDFESAGLVNPEISNEEIINLATDLTILVGMSHDGATVAGGDTFKYLLDIKEEDALERIFFTSRNPEIIALREELLEVLGRRGLEGRHLQFVLKCVQGDSDSLIGQFINPKEGDKLDHDRVAYTLMDCLAATVFGPEIPTDLLPKSLDQQTEEWLLTLLGDATGAIRNPFLAAVFGVGTMPSRRERPPIPVNLVDLAENYQLTDDGRLVCVDPERATIVAAYRVWMIGEHYAGHKMLGLEGELQSRLAKLREGGLLEHIIDTDRLITMSDDELYEALKTVPDYQLQEILARRETVGGTTLFEGSHIPIDQPPPKDAFVSFPILIKPGLDTLVFDDGEIKTLREYAADPNKSYFGSTLFDGLERFDNKRLVIRKLNE